MKNTRFSKLVYSSDMPRLVKAGIDKAYAVERGFCFWGNLFSFILLQKLKTSVAMIRVLFVCLGNICRSPLAEAVMKKKIKEAGLEHQIVTDSCGTSNYHIGEQPDHRTLKNASRNKVDIDHSARQFCLDDFNRFEYILVMDSANMSVVNQLDQAEEYNDKLYLMRDFDPEDLGADVPDPYFGGEEGFQHVFEIIERSVDNFLSYVIDQHDLVKRRRNSLKNSS